MGPTSSRGRRGGSVYNRLKCRKIPVLAYNLGAKLDIVCLKYADYTIFLTSSNYYNSTPTTYIKKLKILFN